MIDEQQPAAPDEQPASGRLTSQSIRSFVLRQGRFTEAQQRAFDLQWSRFGVDYTGAPRDLDALFAARPAPVVLEIGFGNGESRPATRSALTDAQVADKNYHQEAAIPMAAGSETHGGTDVFLGAIGRGADKFTGVITNTEVFNLIRQSVGL